MWKGGLNVCWLSEEPTVVSSGLASCARILERAAKAAAWSVIVTSEDIVWHVVGWTQARDEEKMKGWKLWKGTVRRIGDVSNTYVRSMFFFRLLSSTSANMLVPS